MKLGGMNLVMIAVVVWLAMAPGARAQLQTKQEAVEMLTTGKWEFGGRTIPRTFSPDDTFTSDNGSTGMWRITDDWIEIELGTMRQRYYLPLNPNGTPGDDGKGNKVNLFQVSTGAPAAGSAPPAAVSGEEQKRAAELLHDHLDALIPVDGADGPGVAFIASLNGGNFLMSSVRVAGEIRDAPVSTLAGRAVQGGVPSMAVGEDILCMDLPAGGTPFQLMQGADPGFAVGDEVIMLENAGGTGGLKTVFAKVNRVTPEAVKTDPAPNAGSSGSPIIDLRTGQVMGVATFEVYHRYLLIKSDKAQPPANRKYAFRIDSVKGWQPVSWPAYDAQAKQMAAVDELSEDLYDFYRDLNLNNGNVTPQQHDNPDLQHRIEDWVTGKKSNLSPEDSASADATFLSFLKTTCESDIAAAQSQVTYNCFADELAWEKQERQEMEKSFEQTIQEQAK
jgi:hypothetical protein